MKKSKPPKVRVVAVAGKKSLQLRWSDPTTGKTHQKSSGVTDQKAAIKAAARLEDDLARNPHAAMRLTWEQLCDRYEKDQRLSLAPETMLLWRTARGKVDALIAPRRIEQVNAMALSEMANAMREKGLSAETVKKHFRHLKAMFNWSRDVGLIDDVPRFPKIANRGRSMMARSRPVTAEEFDRVLLAVKKERPHDARQWRRFIEGLAFSGLRIGELHRLRWDAGDGIWLDASGPIPVIRLRSSAHKGGGDRIQVITPEFWKLAQPKRSDGFVFPLISRTTGDRVTRHTACRIVAAIGERAGVLTSPDDKKHATSHDLGRRYFTTRIQQQLSMMETAKIMRHASTQTTMAYYYQPEMMTLAAKLWGTGDLPGDPTPQNATVKEQG